MLANVIYPYRDRETGKVHLAGEAVELTAERFAELSPRGFVADAAEAADDAGDATETVDDAGDAAEAADDAGDSGDAAETADDAEMTVAELRAAIEAEGGFAPKKATKADLASILESLR